MLRALYTLLLTAALPLVFLRLAWRGRRNRAYWRRWNERLGLFRGRPPQAPIWVHAVSVGEVLAAAPLIRTLIERGYPLAVTTTTPTGSERVRALFGDAVFHVYLPFDLPGPVERFLNRVKPRTAVVMETELWPNLFAGCRQRRIPLLVANARLSDRSARGYARLRPLVRETLQRIDLIAAQGAADAERFVALGADPARVENLGNIKYDLALPDGLAERGRALRDALGADRPVLIAASTHEGEETQVLDAFARLRERRPDLLLVLVPRHPERFERVAGLCRERGYRVVRRTEGRPCEADTDVFLGDTLGEMLLFFAAADLAYVGGSLVPTGGHNLLEPAALGLPTLTGPHLHNFREIAGRLGEAGAVRVVHDAAELAEAVDELLRDPAAAEAMGAAGRLVVEANRGVLVKLVVRVEALVERGRGDGAGSA